MSLTAFVYGFISAFIFLAVLVVVGGKKGHEHIKAKLEQLRKEQQANPKAVEAKNLDMAKLTSTVQIHVHGIHSTDHYVPAKFSLTGSKLKIFLIDNDQTAEKPIAILSTKDLSAVPEPKMDPPPRILYVTNKDPTVPLVKSEKEGSPDWTRVDIKFETVRELDRWNNVIHATDRTLAWRQHVKSLPSIDVFNVLASRILFELNNGPEFTDLIKAKITKKLKTVKLPLKGVLTLNEVRVGSEIPFINGVSFLSYNTTGEIGFDFNLTYKGGFFLQLCAQLEVRGHHLPPVIISVQIESLEGNIHLSIGGPPSDKAWIGFHEAPKIQLTIKQEVYTGKERGILSTLVSAIPDLSDLISDVVKVKLFEDMILPNMDDVPLPDVKKTPPSTPVQAPIKPGGKEPSIDPLPMEPSGVDAKKDAKKDSEKLETQSNPPAAKSTDRPIPQRPSSAQPVRSQDSMASSKDEGPGSAVSAPDSNDFVMVTDDRQGSKDSMKREGSKDDAKESALDAVAHRAAARAEGMKNKVGDVISAIRLKRSGGGTTTPPPKGDTTPPPAKPEESPSKDKRKSDEEEGAGDAEMVEVKKTTIDTKDNTTSSVAGGSAPASPAQSVASADTASLSSETKRALPSGYPGSASSRPVASNPVQADNPTQPPGTANQPTAPQQQRPTQPQTYQYRPQSYQSQPQW